MLWRSAFGFIPLSSHASCSQNSQSCCQREKSNDTKAQAESHSKLAGVVFLQTFLACAKAIMKTLCTSVCCRVNNEKHAKALCFIVCRGTAEERRQSCRLCANKHLCSPIGPAPMMATFLPGDTPARLQAWTPTLRGSAMAPSSWLRLDGIG